MNDESNERNDKSQTGESKTMQTGTNDNSQQASPQHNSPHTIFSASSTALGMPPAQTAPRPTQILSREQALRVGMTPAPGVEFVEVHGGQFSVDSLIAGATAEGVTAATAEGASSVPATVPTIDPAVKWFECYLCKQNVLPNFTNARFAYFSDIYGGAFCSGTGNLHTIDPGILLGLRQQLGEGHRCTHEHSVGVSYLGCPGCGGYVHVTIRNASGFEQRLLTQSAEMVKNGMVPVTITHKDNCVAKLTESDMDCTCDPEIVWGTLEESLAMKGAGSGAKLAS